MRSVWSRLFSGSVKLVSPSVNNPARSTALFNCALATFEVIDPGRMLPLSTRTGGRPFSPVVTVAPSSRSGAATRSIGLRESDASPMSVAGTPAPARTPVKSRMVVPEFPQSSDLAGGRRPRKPTPKTMASSGPMSGSCSGKGKEPAGREGTGCALHGVPSPRNKGTPSCARHRAVDRTSPPGARPAIRLSPSASEAKSSARCEMLLSPGTRRSSPRSFCRSGWTRAFTP